MVWISASQLSSLEMFYYQHISIIHLFNETEIFVSYGVEGQNGKLRKNVTYIYYMQNKEINTKFLYWVRFVRIWYYQESKICSAWNIFMCVITTSKCFLAFVHIWFHRNIEHVRASLEEGRKVRCFNQFYVSVNLKIGLFIEIGNYQNQSKSLISFNAFDNLFSARY